MRTLTLAAVITFTAVVDAAPPARQFGLEGQPFMPTAPVIWAAGTTNIPESAKVYRVLPSQFSEEAVSYLLSLSGFTRQGMRQSPKKNVMSWRAYENNHARLVRSLDIAPAYGYVEYHDYDAVGISTNDAESVPARDDMDRLAMYYLKLLGGDTNELCLSHHSGTERKHSLFDKKQKRLVSYVTMRGGMYARQLDGIRFLGAGGRGGFAVDFGSHGKIATLEFDWRNLAPYQSYKTLKGDEIVKEVRDGKAVISAENRDIPEKPKKLTITQVTLYYMSATSGTPEDFVYPIASLDISADTESTNTTKFYLDCPILLTNASERK